MTSHLLLRRGQSVGKRRLDLVILGSLGLQSLKLREEQHGNKLYPLPLVERVLDQGGLLLPLQSPAKLSLLRSSAT
jgi:hypothetical protein